MPSQVRWLGARSPVWDDMTVTTTLEDGSVGDTSTGVVDSESQSGTSTACSLVSPLAVITAMKWMGGYQNTFTQFSAKFAMTLTDNEVTICSQPIGSPVIAPSDYCSLVFEVWNATTGSWTLLYSSSFATPAHGYESGDTTVSHTVSAQAVAPTNSCWARLRIEYQLYSVEGLQGVTASLSLTDWRTTAVATATACTDSGGDPPSGDDIPATITNTTNNIIGVTRNCVFGSTVAARSCFFGAVASTQAELVVIAGLSGTIAATIDSSLHTVDTTDYTIDQSTYAP